MRKISELILLGMIVAILAPVWAAETAQPAPITKKYPPYPDVWGVEKLIRSLCEADNGEVYIVSPPGFPLGGNLDTWEFQAFFDQTTSEIPSEKASLIVDSEKPIPNAGMLLLRKA